MIEGRLFVESDLVLAISIHGVKHAVLPGTPMEIRLGGVWIPGHFAIQEDRERVGPVFHDENSVVVGIVSGILARLKSL